MGQEKSNDTTLTRAILEEQWNNVINTHGTERFIGTNLPIQDENTDDDIRSFLLVLPLYLVAVLLKCKKCGNCCRPNQRKWDRYYTFP